MAAAVTLQPSATGQAFGAASVPGSAAEGKDAGGLRSSFLQPSDIHVLVVDDERLSRTIVSSLLRKCCYKVTVVDSGVTALQALKTAQPGTFNLVLTDLVMPEVDGLDLLRYVREDENLRSVPVVMMSASERSETIFECIKDGAEDYLLKPLKPKEVEYIWQHVWRRQHSAGIVPRLGDEEDFFDAAPRFGDGNVPVPAEQGPCLTSEPAFRPARDASALAEASPSVAVAEQHVAGNAVQHRAAPAVQLPTQFVGTTATGAETFSSRALSSWLTRRRHLDTRDAFEVFCRLVSLLKAYHLQGKPFGRLRPSQLAVTASGAVNELPAAPTTAQQAAAFAVEHARYASPEEESGSPPSQASDVFSLGMLFVDLFYTVGTDATARAALLQSVRDGVLPDVASCKPEEVAFLTAALAPEPAARLKLIDLVYSDLLPRLLASLSTPARGGPAGPSKAAAEVAETAAPAAATATGRPQLRQPGTLLTFLDMMRNTKSVEVDVVGAELALLDADIAHAKRVLAARRSRLRASAGASAAAGADQQHTAAAAAVAGLKRERSVAALAMTAAAGAAAKRPKINAASTPAAVVPLQQQPAAVRAAVEAKFNRLTPVIGQLEGVYRQRRTQSGAPYEGLAAFCRDLASYSRYSRLVDRATVRYVDLHNLNDLVCSVAYDRDEEYFATAGVSRRLKVFDFQSVLENDAPIHYPVLEINARSKLSCVVWNPYVKSNILCSDYDGTIQLWDASTKQELMQFDEHARRVWSVDFASADPTRFLSGSDDHTVKLWSLNCENSVATMDAKANVCSVQFHPTDSNVVACGAANYRVYLHDLRNTSAPLAVLSGHNKAVSYVRFLDSGHLVSAATDHQLRLWDLPSACAMGRTATPALVYRGHVNEKNFVGLSISRDGYIACGSEDNSAYVYAPTLPIPVTRYQFSARDGGAAGASDAGAVGSGGMGTGRPGAASSLDGMYQHFVSSVAWSHRSRYLTVANSMGVLKVLETC